MDLVTYAAAERTLAKLHGKGGHDADRGPFRGRLKHLQRLGVPMHANLMRGQRPTYAVQHLYQWAFCLDLEEFGIDPNAIASFLQAHWPRLYAIYNMAKARLIDSNVRTILLFDVAFLSENTAGSARLNLIDVIEVKGKDSALVHLGSSGRAIMLDVSKSLKVIEALFSTSSSENA